MARRNEAAASKPTLLASALIAPPSSGPVLPPACATVAEVRKRGEEFWSEFEFYLSDLLVSWRLCPAPSGRLCLFPAAAVPTPSGRLCLHLAGGCACTSRHLFDAALRVTAAGHQASRRCHLADAASGCHVLQVGLVLDVVLVTLIAPVARTGRKTAQAGVASGSCLRLAVLFSERTGSSSCRNDVSAHLGGLEETWRPPSPCLFCDACTEALIWRPAQHVIRSCLNLLAFPLPIPACSVWPEALPGRPAQRGVPEEHARPQVGRGRPGSHLRQAGPGVLAGWVGATAAALLLVTFTFCFCCDFHSGPVWVRAPTPSCGWGSLDQGWGYQCCSGGRGSSHSCPHLHLETGRCLMSPLLYPSPAAAGIVCGFIGQGLANSLMLLKRKCV